MPEQEIEAHNGHQTHGSNDKRRTVGNRICTLYYIADTLEALVEANPHDGERDDIVSGPLRLVSRTLRAEASALHYSLNARLDDLCPMILEEALEL